MFAHLWIIKVKLANLFCVNFQANIGRINKIKIINALGQLQINKTVEVNEMDINISELKNGLYFIKFYNDDKLIAFRKLVKE